MVLNCEVINGVEKFPTIAILFEVVQIIFEWWGINAHKMLTGTPQVSSSEKLFVGNCEICGEMVLGQVNLKKHPGGWHMKIRLK